MSIESSAQQPNPGIVFETLASYQRSAGLKTAIELNIFSEISKGNHTAEAIASAAKASVRGVRILCDYLVIIGFLLKEGDRYSMTLDAALFLDRNSPAYFGDSVHFLLDPKLTEPYLHLTEIVRTGSTTIPDGGTVSRDNPIWVRFAESMAPMMFGAAEEIADLVAGDGQMRVLDIAAGHGIFGIMIARKNPQARITALDWANVLAVATGNAKKFGVEDRHTALAGDAFETEFGGPYDIVLATNFFHHFDMPTCETLMKKIHRAMAPGGRCVTLDFVPNDDRVSPPAAASFAMMMLGTTQSGNVYTLAEYDRMFRKSGFGASEHHILHKSPETVIVTGRD